MDRRSQRQRECDPRSLRTRGARRLAVHHARHHRAGGEWRRSRCASGFSLLRGWLACAIVLYLFAGACWLPVVWLQMRMRDLACQADREGMPLPDAYHRHARLWFWLGVPAFLALLVVF